MVEPEQSVPATRLLASLARTSTACGPPACPLPQRFDGIGPHPRVRFANRPITHFVLLLPRPIILTAFDRSKDWDGV